MAKKHSRADDVALALMEHVRPGSLSGVEASRNVPFLSTTTLILFTAVFGLFGLFAVVGLLAPHGDGSEQVTATCVLVVSALVVLACIRPLLLRRRSDHRS